MPKPEAWVELPDQPNNIDDVLANTDEKDIQTILDDPNYKWFEKMDGSIAACSAGHEPPGCGQSLFVFDKTTGGWEAGFWSGMYCTGH